MIRSLFQGKWLVSLSLFVHTCQARPSSLEASEGLFAAVGAGVPLQ